MNVSHLAPNTPLPSSTGACPPRSRETEEVFPGAGDRIVTCRDSAGESRAVLDTPDWRAAPPLQRGLGAIALGVIAAPALGAIAEEGGLAAFASFGAKALEGLRESVTKPEEIGKLVGGGVAFELLKGVYERAAPVLGESHAAFHDAPHPARSPSP